MINIYILVVLLLQINYNCGSVKSILLLIKDTLICLLIKPVYVEQKLYIIHL